MFDLASDAGQSCLDASSFPIFVLCGAGRVRDANRAACSYFGQSRESLRDADALGARGYSPSRRAEYAKRFEAWVAGELVPFVVAWPPRTGEDRFLVVPQSIGHRGQPAVALALIPLGVVEAALAGESAESARLPHAWLRQRSTDAVTPASDPLLATLTPREWEIARRLAEGDRVPLVVEDLGIAENTVRNHLKSIFRKLHVASQAQLVRRLKPKLASARRA